MTEPMNALVEGCLRGTEPLRILRVNDPDTIRGGAAAAPRLGTDTPL